MTTKNVLIVGVGGQGILLASELLSEVAFTAGLDVKKSEVHGMAQRGGVVSSHVRIGSKVYSPLIREGQADIILSFEVAEALRWIHFLKTNGTAIINNRKLVPPVALMKGMAYPNDPIKDVKKHIQNVKVIKAAEIAESLGNPRVANILLLGVLSNSLKITKDIGMKCIRMRVPKGTQDVNIQAFERGREGNE